MKNLISIPEFYSFYLNKKILFLDDSFLSYKIDYNDINCKSILDQSKLDGLTIRFWTPTSVGTMDYRRDRLNFSINKDGIIYRIYIG